MSNKINLSELLSAIENNEPIFEPKASWQDVKIEIGELSEAGIVKSISEGIARVSGLYNSFLHEVIQFDNEIFGIVRVLDEFEVHVVMFNNWQKISAGDIVRRTHKMLHISVNDHMIGRVLDVFGNPIDGGVELEAVNEVKVEYVKPPSMIARKPVSTPLLTGTMAVDSMIPIGRGQRELILGEMKTGKTSLAIGAIINQKHEYLSGKPVYCFYVAIGQSQSSVASIVRRLKDENAMEYTTIIAAFAADSAHNQFIAPYVGCAIAEYFMQKGHDCLIIYDDLSKHAVANRQINRLMGMPGGRDAHPADSFYIHSRLLERAACTPNGTITAMPIIEIKEGELDYIATNVISITDGQIVLSKTRMHNQMPAINIGLSVSRVGSSAQSKAMKMMSSNLKSANALYEDVNKLKSFAGDQLDEAQLKVLSEGDIMLSILNQDLEQLYDLSDQVILLIASKTNVFKDIPRHKMKEKVNSFLTNIKLENKEIVKAINENSITQEMIDIILKQTELIANDAQV